MDCPQCKQPMHDDIIETKGIIVHQKKFLHAMKELDEAAERGVSLSRDGGLGACIISPLPEGMPKLAHCKHCWDCELIIVSRRDALPEEEYPPSYREGWLERFKK